MLKCLVVALLFTGSGLAVAQPTQRLRSAEQVTAPAPLAWRPSAVPWPEPGPLFPPPRSPQPDHRLPFGMTCQGYGLRTQNTPLLVYNNLPLSEEEVQELPVADLVQVQWLPPAAAAATFGTRGSNGAYLIRGLSRSFEARLQQTAWSPQERRVRRRWLRRARQPNEQLRRQLLRQREAPEPAAAGPFTKHGLATARLGRRLHPGRSALTLLSTTTWPGPGRWPRFRTYAPAPDTLALPGHTLHGLRYLCFRQRLASITAPVEPAAWPELLRVLTATYGPADSTTLPTDMRWWTPGANVRLQRPGTFDHQAAGQLELSSPRLDRRIHAAKLRRSRQPYRGRLGRC
jgi:uncharacterized membrane protein